MNWLVDDWNKAHKWLSIQLAVVLTMAETVHAIFPEMMQAYVPAPWFNRAMIVLGAAVIIGRLIKQAPSK